MKTKLVLISFLLILAIPLQAFAVCPVCTVAIAGGVGLSRWLHVDDTITGLWIGGLLISLTFWTLNWLNKKKIQFFGRNFIIAAIFYIASIYPLFYSDIIGHPQNQIWGLDKLVVGIIFGTFVTLLAVLTYPAIKKSNSGSPIFPFQKVTVPIVLLLIASTVFYYITK